MCICELHLYMGPEPRQRPNIQSDLYRTDTFLSLIIPLEIHSMTQFQHQMTQDVLEFRFLVTRCHQMRRCLCFIPRQLFSQYPHREQWGQFFKPDCERCTGPTDFMEFVEQLDDVELSQGYFQQDGATCHTLNESMDLIASFFDDRLISRNLQPPRSLDLTTPTSFYGVT